MAVSILFRRTLLFFAILLNMEDYLAKAKTMRGKRVSELGLDLVIPEYNPQEAKGFFGLVTEQYFGIAQNSSSNPDLGEIELKASGFNLKGQLGEGVFNAKERLVFGMIDYQEIARKERLIDLGIWKKFRKVLIVIYHYERQMDVRFIHSFLWEPDSTEIRILQEDYSKMRQEVLSGEHLGGKGYRALDNFPKHAGQYYSAYRKGGRQNLTPGVLGECSSHPRLKDAERRGLGLKNRFFTEITAKSLGVDIVSHGAAKGIDSSIILDG